MRSILRLTLEIALGIALAAGAASVRGMPAGHPEVRSARAGTACVPLHDGLWRGGSLLPRRRVLFVGLTQPKMMPIMKACGSAKHA